MRKVKSLYSISIENCSFNTQLQYNLKTNHIGIGTTFRYPRKYYIDNEDKIKEYNINNKNERKQYNINNKDRIKEQRKQYRETTRDPNMSRSGSKESRIKMSCGQQGISIRDFKGFLTDQKYCKLFNETFKELIRNRFHRECYLCSKLEGKRKLSVHHVNYDKNCLCGSSCEFVPLCQSCHCKTNHNRQTWEDLIMCYLFPNRYFMVDL